MPRQVLSAAVLSLGALLVRAADPPAPPEATISNGVIEAKLYLPDAATGYYRGTRFDWSGVFASLTYKGHNFYGPWFDQYDPKTHDAISGPVEEFFSGFPPVGYESATPTALGYSEAKPGSTFLRIGVGVLRKPVEEKFDRFKTYEIVDNGHWTVTAKKDRVTFHQEVSDPSSGYGYAYTKTARLEPGKPVLILDHALKNTGTKAFSTDVYDHNFLVMDSTPTGRGFTLTFPYDVKATGDLNGFVETRGHQLVYVKDIGAKGDNQFVMAELLGHGSMKSDYDIRVENKKTGAGVHITGDRPLYKVLFWSVNTVLSPEPYLHFDIKPGETVGYQIRYEFYEVK